MNGIGIDLGEQYAVVCLRDGAGRAARFRMIGDGRRSAIPLALSPSGRWGTAALADLAALPQPTATPPPGWWSALAERLRGFLGGVLPNAASGYQITIAADHDQDAVRVGVSAAGLGRPRVVSRPAALVGRWLAAHPDADAEVIVAVAIGDASTTVAAYRLSASRALRGTRCSPMVQAAWGATTWATTLLDRLSQRLRDPAMLGGLDAASRSYLWEATVRVGARLARVPPTQGVRWDGPLSDAVFEPLVLTAADCRAWEAATRFGQFLSRAIGAVCAAAGTGAAEALVVAGGTGATWPFVLDAGRDLGARTWLDDAPDEAVARGATWGQTLGTVVDVDPPVASSRLPSQQAEPATPTVSLDAPPAPPSVRRATWDWLHHADAESC